MNYQLGLFLIILLHVLANAVVWVCVSVCLHVNPFRFRINCLLYGGGPINGGTPKPSILRRFSIEKQPCCGSPIYGNTHPKETLFGKATPVGT